MKPLSDDHKKLLQRIINEIDNKKLVEQLLLNCGYDEKDKLEYDDKLEKNKLIMRTVKSVIITSMLGMLLVR